MNKYSKKFKSKEKVDLSKGLDPKLENLDDLVKPTYTYKHRVMNADKGKPKLQQVIIDITNENFHNVKISGLSKDVKALPIANTTVNIIKNYDSKINVDVKQAGLSVHAGDATQTLYARSGMTLTDKVSLAEDDTFQNSLTDLSGTSYNDIILAYFNKSNFIIVDLLLNARYGLIKAYEDTTLLNEWQVSLALKGSAQIERTSIQAVLAHTLGDDLKSTPMLDAAYEVSGVNFIINEGDIPSAAYQAIRLYLDIIFMTKALTHIIRQFVANEAVIKAFAPRADWSKYTKNLDYMKSSSFRTALDRLDMVLQTNLLDHQEWNEKKDYIASITKPFPGKSAAIIDHVINNLFTEIGKGDISENLTYKISYGDGQQVTNINDPVFVKLAKIVNELNWSDFMKKDKTTTLADVVSLASSLRSAITTNFSVVKVFLSTYQSFEPISDTFNAQILRPSHSSMLGFGAKRLRFKRNLNINHIFKVAPLTGETISKYVFKSDSENTLNHKVPVFYNGYNGYFINDNDGSNANMLNTPGQIILKDSAPNPDAALIIQANPLFQDLYIIQSETGPVFSILFDDTIGFMGKTYVTNDTDPLAIDTLITLKGAVNANRVHPDVVGSTNIVLLNIQTIIEDAAKLQSIVWTDHSSTRGLVKPIHIEEPQSGISRLDDIELEQD